MLTIMQTSTDEPIGRPQSVLPGRRVFSRLLPSVPNQGQSLVEFAISVTALLLLFLAGVQFAIIVNAALSVSELAYAGARYAAINETADASTVENYVKSIASPTINENSGGDISVAVSPAAPRTRGTPVSVSITYNLQSKLFLPTSFFNVNLPTSLPPIQNTIASE